MAGAVMGRCTGESSMRAGRGRCGTAETPRVHGGNAARASSEWRFLWLSPYAGRRLFYAPHRGRSPLVEGLPCRGVPIVFYGIGKEWPGLRWSK